MQAEQAKNFLNSHPQYHSKMPFWQVEQPLYSLLIWYSFDLSTIYISQNR